jgi:putative Mg2+ transporter-C (MgtC) family protein
MDIGNDIGFVQTHLPQHIIAIRILIAAVLGALIGFERERNTAEAGLRTHILVATAAALFTILAFEIFHTIEPGSGGSQADPIRAVEAVTAGIAFLGAGAIFRSGGNVQGLTTGAGMWLAGAVGVATALGYYLVAGGVALLAVIVLAALRALAHNVIRGDEADEERPIRERAAGRSGSPRPRR